MLTRQDDGTTGRTDGIGYITPLEPHTLVSNTIDVRCGCHIGKSSPYALMALHAWSSDMMNKMLGRSAATAGQVTARHNRVRKTLIRDSHEKKGGTVEVVVVVSGRLPHVDFHAALQIGDQ